jgi:pilus assembly protein CpaC
VAGLEDYIKRFIPNSDIKVELLNDNVVLTGTVETPLDAKRAAELAQHLRHPAARRRPASIRRPRPGGIRGGGVDINNPDQERRQTSQIVNLLQDRRRGSGHAEGDGRRSQPRRHEAARRQLIGSGGSDGISWGAVSDRPSASASRSSTAASLGGTSLLDAYVNAMEQAGVMKTLAEPTLDRGVGRAGDIPRRRRVQSGHRPALRRRATTIGWQLTYTSRSWNTASAASSSRWCCRLAASA